MSAPRITIATLLTLAALVGALAGCSVDSGIPQPTGEARAAIELPPELPADLPLIGVVVAAEPVNDGGWSVTTISASAAQLDTAVDALTTAGMRVIGSDTTDPRERHYSFTGEDWLISLTLKDDGQELLALYSVAPRS